MQSALIESGVVRTIEAISSSSSSDIQGELWPLAVAPEWQQWVDSVRCDWPLSTQRAFHGIEAIRTPLIYCS